MDQILENIYYMGGLICHQRPERSFVLAGNQFALCARCTGMYLSLLLTVVVFPLRYIRSGYRILFIVLSFSLFLNLFKYVDVCDTNLIRFFLGLLIGVPSGLILKKSFKIVFKGEHS